MGMRGVIIWSFKGLEQVSLSVLCVVCGYLPRGSIYTSIMEIGTERPSLFWFGGPNSIIGVYIYISSGLHDSH